MCTERKATGLFVLTDFLCDNDNSSFYEVIKAGTENRNSPDINFGCNRRFGPARSG